MKILERSGDIYWAQQQRAHELIPGGAHTYAKGDDQYPVSAPAFISRGEGCHVWDTQGRRYIEYGMGNRAVSLGHAYPSVLDAVRSELGNGCNFTRPAAIELACAEKFLELIEGAEMVKFCKDGSDATSAAVRLARAYTGRDLIARCGDHPFFSTDDWFIGTTQMSAGIPRDVSRLTLSFSYNDLGAVQSLFERHPNSIAAVILEAARVQEPGEGYLQGLVDLCHANGALAIFDEMITGFRWDIGGAQKLYGVTPDLSCFGKAIANGFSVSALAGKREFMRLGGIHHTDRPRVFLLSTTHGAETHALAAAIATMREYQEKRVVEALYNSGARLKAGFEELIAKHGLEGYAAVAGRPCCLLYEIRDRDKKLSQAFRTLFIQELISRGVLAPSFVVSFTHTNAILDQTLEAVDEALGVHAAALADGFDKYLIGRPSQPVFRERNHI